MNTKSKIWEKIGDLILSFLNLMLAPFMFFCIAIMFIVSILQGFKRGLKSLSTKIFKPKFPLDKPCRKHFWLMKEFKDCSICGWSGKFTKQK